MQHPYSQSSAGTEHACATACFFAYTQRDADPKRQQAWTDCQKVLQTVSVTS
jgi:hypothetical protein